MKNFKLVALCAIVLSLLLTGIYIYQSNIKLDVYKWNLMNNTLSIGEKVYKQNDDFSNEIHVDKVIGRIENEEYKVWSIKGEDSEEYIAIRGFMFPAVGFTRQND